MFKSIILAIHITLFAALALAQNSSFTYQGKLADGGNPAI